MRNWAAFYVLGTVAITLLMMPAHAQQRVEDTAEMTQAGEAYLKSIRFRGVETDAAYYDPSRPAPALDTKETPDPKDGVDVRLTDDQGSFVVNAIAIAVLLGIAYLFLRFGGQFSVSLRGDRDAQRNISPGKHGSDHMGVAIQDLDAIERMVDRNLALVALAQSALIRAVRSNGLLLQRSWTARDAFRRLPKDMAHRDALHNLVTAGERVLFGGREVPEADFQDHLARIRPLFSEATS